MKILAVDTASAWQSVAILDDHRVFARQDQEAAGSHAKLLLPTIDRLFRETGLSLRRLDGLAVSIGPGSFTGLRVGLATMLGFRTITQLPLATVPTLEAMAWNFRGSPDLLCPVLTSRRGEVYWAVFRWINDDLERVLPEQVGSPVQLAETLVGPTVLFGDGWIRDAAAIRAALPRALTITEKSGETARPSAVSVGRAGIERLSRGEQAGMIVSPYYVQRSEAELAYDQSKGLSPLARRRAKLSRTRGGRMAGAGAKRRDHK
ncbi:MAG TPA: tRNA (adenosine(37)-N6)-threonylcarbamoyltransferase complex dimerization subunit type 1 TsaB, partial [Nitrospira sp.]|nr:tRNA (adenosine(37)-N6)-threonylcarbamoyltransferase complex dimerization subunit type 1 TsaB [Nitrospira sp.]